MISSWLSEEYVKTTVLFELSDGKGNFYPHGTGALLNYKQAFVLATCKHIVLNPKGDPYKGLHATINKTDGEASRKSLEEIHKTFGLKWFFHKNPNVDIAVSAIAIEQKVEDIKLIPEDLLEDFVNIPLGEDIFFLGYPLNLGISNVPKLSPLVRVGVVALKNSDSTFFIDANVYPGSSGSPLFYRPVVAKMEDGNTKIGSARPMKLLGLVSNSISEREEAVSKKTGEIRAIFMDNAGLGIVQSASLLKEILEYPEFQKILPQTQQAQANAEKQPDKDVQVT